ncbi:hypothetical protein FH972_018112 [Carpinus fangiana]|uniref:Uncharacterized protein n=1 Tax=Carpinus fangiana TaxID=176857 RepID=A0A5N6RP00_9ROSI|nr:hypothetical protein FH972_018112 [Carpinus fangiana]
MEAGFPMSSSLIEGESHDEDGSGQGQTRHIFIISLPTLPPDYASNILKVEAGRKWLPLEEELEVFQLSRP